VHDPQRKDVYEEKGKIGIFTLLAKLQEEMLLGGRLEKEGDHKEKKDGVTRDGEDDKREEGGE